MSLILQRQPVSMTMARDIAARGFEAGLLAVAGWEVEGYDDAAWARIRRVVLAWAAWQVRMAARVRAGASCP